MDVFVVYWDSGAYTDWHRDVIGVYGSLEAAQTGAATYLAQFAAVSDGVRAAGLSAWACEAEPFVTPAPVARWGAKSTGANEPFWERIDCYIEQWPLEA